MQKLELYEFQKLGARFLAGKSHAILGDEMGIGKTPQSIAAADLILAERLLVITPSVAKINWLREFERFSEFKRPITIIEHETDEIPPGHTIIVSFGLATSIPPERFGEFSVLIIDEAHLLKSITAKRSGAIIGTKGLIHRARRCWFLTGTPAPNNAGELWPILYTIGATDLSYERWVDIFCNSYIYQGRKTISGTNVSKGEELRALLSKFMLRRKKEQVLPQLPEITFKDVYVPKGHVDIEKETSFIQYVYPIDRRPELVSILEKEEMDVTAILDRLGSGDQAMAALEAMAKSVSTLRRYRGLQKVESVIEILREELASKAYEKIVLFAIHRDVIDGLRRGLSKFHPVTLYGGTDPTKKQENIDAFQKDEKTRVMICNIQAAGAAVTLTRAHNVGFVEEDWVPGNNAQAAMRCHRIGQKNAVLVRRFLLDDPLDKRVSVTLQRKTKELLSFL